MSRRNRKKRERSQCTQKARQEWDEPEGVEEWQSAVDAARCLFCIDMLCALGHLAFGGSRINVRRCSEILRVGRSLGYHPTAEGVRDHAEVILEKSVGPAVALVCEYHADPRSFMPKPPEPINADDAGQS